MKLVTANKRNYSRTIGPSPWLCESLQTDIDPPSTLEYTPNTTSTGHEYFIEGFLGGPGSPYTQSSHPGVWI